MTSPAENGERKLQPLSIIDLEALQTQYPDPANLDIISMCEAATIHSIDTSERDSFTVIKEELYGDRLDQASQVLSEIDGSAELATSLFIDTFNHGVPQSTDIDPLAWRLALFSTDSALGRKYVGGRLSISDAKDKILDNHNFGAQIRAVISLVQVVRFCEANPELEQAAVDLWAGSSLPSVNAKGHMTYRYIPLSDVIQKEIIKGQKPEIRQERFRILEKLRTSVQWQNKIPAQYQYPTPKNAKVSLELMPINHIDLDEITLLQVSLLSDNFDQEWGMKQPVELLTSALKATQNFLTSLTADDPRRASRTGRIVAELEKYDGDNPLGYADVTAIVEEQLTPDMQRQIPDISKMDPKQLVDFPKAIERLLFVALNDKREELAASGEKERFSLAADCIRQLAFRGVEAKLEQRVLSVGDVVMRYAALPAKELSQLIERQQTAGLSEPDLDRVARTMKRNKVRQPFKSGWGSLS